LIKVGDVFEISIIDNRKAYGQYVYKCKLGPMVKIFDILISEREVTLQELAKAGSLFPPIITGLYAAIKVGLWRKIGKLPVEDYSHTKYILPRWNDKTGIVLYWSLWDGMQFIRLGKDLPEKYKNLEICGVWSPYDVIWRIENNKIPFPYEDMIKFGRFTPKQTN
jgi:hypothetical protein